MAGNEHIREQEEQQPRGLREAMGVAARKTMELDQSSEPTGDADQLSTSSIGDISADTGTTPDTLLVRTPEISEHARNTLLGNLALSPMDREKIHPEAFHSSRYNPLQYRLEVLTSDIFSGLREANTDVWKKIKAILESKVSSSSPSTLDDLAIGAALVIEAYQIDTDRNLVKGFANIDESEVSHIESGFSLIPTKGLSPSLIDQPARKWPEQGYLALVEDVRLIGELTVERNPLAMRFGAQGAMSALTNGWRHIYSPELPPYEPSRYKSDDRLI